MVNTSSFRMQHSPLWERIECRDAKRPLGAHNDAPARKGTGLDTE